MKCLVCRGACCETFQIGIDFAFPGSFGARDTHRWLSLHAIETVGNDFHFNCRCSKLAEDGSCSIYEDRPLICELYVAGGPDCLKTVRERRTPEQYQEIRDEWDPK